MTNFKQNQNFGGGAEPRLAFTLAEILITLGIIGVVAAMTMPVLVANHKKTQTVVKLQAAMTLINNAFRQAVADYGDMKEWEYVDSFTNVNSRKAFVDKYLIPYLKGAEPSSRAASNYQELGYSSKLYPRQPNGSNLGMSSTNYYPVALLNGIYFYSGLETYLGVDYLTFHVDLNGKSGPNVYGSDLFVFVLVPDKNIVKMYTYNRPKPSADGTYGWCSNSNATGCGLIIELNGWKIPDSNYPVKF